MCLLLLITPVQTTLSAQGTWQKRPLQTLIKEVRRQDGQQADKIVISCISFAHPMGSHLQSISRLCSCSTAPEWEFS